MARAKILRVADSEKGNSGRLIWRSAGVLSQDVRGVMARTHEEVYDEVWTGLRERGVILLSYQTLLELDTPIEQLTQPQYHAIEHPQTAAIQSFPFSTYEASDILRELSWLRAGDTASIAMARDENKGGAFEPAVLLMGFVKWGTRPIVVV
jgi:hypothetical protein